MMSEITQETTQQIWYGCYDGGWKNLIQPESIAHPAKFSRSLISRIYSYALEKGYLKPGDTVLDTFAGVGLGALDAGANGLNWVGCELETRFWDMGQGCDCTGITPEEWQEFNEQFKPDTIGQLNYKAGRHWCPACTAGAIQIKSNGLSDYRQPGLFEATEDSRLPTPFKLAEDGTPYSLPHHYTGNLELFRKYAKLGTFAVLLNGDSRNLRAVIGQAVADGLLSSPPYANGEKGHPSLGSVNKDDWGKDGRDIAGRRGLDGNYGGTEGQLANMPLGDAILSSPPFAGNTGGRGEASRNGIDPALFDRHSGGMKKGTGDNPGNLDHLPMRGFDAALGSPPFGQAETRDRNTCQGGFVGDMMGRAYTQSRQGESDGQLGAMPPGSFDAALSSPPWSDSTGSDDPDKRGGLLKSDPKRRGDRNLTGSYGTSDGQLGAMPAGMVSSPPFESSLATKDKKFWDKHNDDTQNWNGATRNTFDYGTTAGQLGTEQGQTFWAAARQIVSEAWLCLKPGAYTFWVVKAFIRDKKRVDFPDQWRQLCEACGFEYVESIYAMQISKAQYQQGLAGEAKKIQKATKSFFRRTYEKKFPDNRIDWEEVLVMKKPAANGKVA